MQQRTRQAPVASPGTSDRFDLDSYSDSELDSLLFTEPAKEERPGALNLPMLMGFATLLVGVLYVLGEVGGGLLNLIGLGGAAPDFSGVVPFTLFLGFLTMIFSGVFSRRKKPKRVRTKAKRTGNFQLKIGGDGKRLAKSRDKKIAGVAAGIGEHFGIDPKLVRIAFVVGAFATQGAAVALYAILALVLPKPEAPSLEERIRIIRDS